MERTENIEVVFSFDTTGSMYPCLTQVRREVEHTLDRLFKEIPNIKIGITAHGDYCDAGTSYVTRHHEISDDRKSLASFVRKVEATHGGDAPECYELVLHEARSFNWTKSKSRVLVLIGDDVPHGPSDRQNTKKLDWRNEIAMLAEMGVHVYGVQALGKRHATPFYEEIARSTGGFRLELNQFSAVTDMILAIAFQQTGGEHLANFEKKVKDQGRMDRSLDAMFSVLSGRTKAPSYAPSSLDAVPPSRFQVLMVEADQDIKSFVLANGLKFNTGRGFYEFTKRESIQGYKEVVLLDRKNGDMFSGTKARELLGLGSSEARLSPTNLSEYRVFVQSTSANRKLVKGTGFLYEVDEAS